MTIRDLFKACYGEKFWLFWIFRISILPSRPEHLAIQSQTRRYSNLVVIDFDPGVKRLLRKKI